MSFTSRILLPLIMVLGGGMSAHAQFFGDFYFASDTLMAEPGETVSLEVLTFVGTTNLGAAHFELGYDPSRIRVVSVEPGGSQYFQNRLSSREEPGKVAVVALNDRSASAPFGVVSLARIEILPLLEEGQSVALTLTPREALDTSGNTLNVGAGGSATVMIGVNVPNAVRLPTSMRIAPPRGTVERVRRK